MFKVGDRVRVSTTRHGQRQFGDEGIVIELRKQTGAYSVYLPIRVEFGVDRKQTPKRNVYAESDLELIGPKLKVGFRRFMEKHGL